MSSEAKYQWAPFAKIGDDSIGQGIVETLRGHRSKAVLMKQHGVFAIGANAREALKACCHVRGRRKRALT